MVAAPRSLPGSRIAGMTVPRRLHGLALIPAEPPSKARAEALAKAALGHLYANRHTEAMAPAREAVAVAECVGDTETLVYAHHVLVSATSRLGDYGDARTLALANLARCGPDVSAERTLTAYHSLAVALIDLGRQAEVPALVEPAVALARRSGLGDAQGAILTSDWLRSLTALGRWTEAGAVVTECGDPLDYPLEPGGLRGGGALVHPPGAIRGGSPAGRTGACRIGPTLVVGRSRLTCRRHRHVRHRRRARLRCRGACQRDA